LCWKYWIVWCPPLVKYDTGEIIGLMFFGLPVDVTIKEKLFAMSIDEVEKEIK
jgi:hypothetical protein